MKEVKKMSKADKKLRMLGFVRTDESNCKIYYKNANDYSDCIKFLEIDKLNFGFVAYFKYDKTGKQYIACIEEKLAKLALKKIKELKLKGNQNEN